MTKTRKFIEKAIEGGYKGRGIASDGSWYGDSVFLIPDVWKAVGRAEGWCERVTRCDDCSHQWHDEMHYMIDALTEGKTIEEYLATIL